MRRYQPPAGYSRRVTASDCFYRFVEIFRGRSSRACDDVPNFKSNLRANGVASAHAHAIVR